MREQARLMAEYFGIGADAREAAILRLLVDLSVAVCGAEEGSLLAFDREANKLRFLMTSGGKDSEKVLLGQSVPMGQGVTGRAAQTMSVQTGTPVFRDIRQAERLADPDRGAASDDPEAVLAAPMALDEQLIGVLTAVSFQPGKRFSSRDMECAASMATVAAVVVNQAARLSSMASASGDRSAGVSDGGFEARIVRSAARIARDRPQSLPLVAELVETVERLAVSPGTHTVGE